MANEDKETLWKTCVEKRKKVRGHWEGGVVLLAIHVCLVRAEKEKKYSLSPTGMDANQCLRTEGDAQWGELLEQVISKAYEYGLDSQTVLDNRLSSQPTIRLPMGSPRHRRQIYSFPI